MAWHAVDPHVLDEFEQYTHHRVGYLWDLAKAVDLKDYNLANDHFQKLMGSRVAEFEAQDHLAAAGISLSATFHTNATLSSNPCG